MTNASDGTGQRGVTVSMASGDVDADFGPVPFDMALAPTRSPLYHLMLPANWMEFLGHVALQWGAFEQIFNEFLMALLKRNATILKSDVLALRFDQRKALFQDELAKASELNFLQKRFDLMFADADELYTRRNAILHGNICIEVQAGGGPVIMATGRRNKRLVTHRYTFDDLKVLAHDLAHLAGRMSEVAKGEQQLRIEPHERQRLRDFLRDNHPNPASGNMLLYWHPDLAGKDTSQP
jgi:hypothetical protein